MVVQMSFKIERTTLSKRNHRKAMNEANRAAMTWLLRYVIPRKFTPRASREFPGHFWERARKYQERKRSWFGHNLPLVYTGQMRSRVLGQSKVTATYKHAALTMKPGHAIRTEQRAELEAISPAHKKRMSQIVLKKYMQLSQDPRFLRRKTTRSKK